MTASQKNNINVCIRNFACPTQGMLKNYHQYFQLNGYPVIPGYKNADLLFIITCGVTTFNDKFIIQYIKKFQKYLNHNAEVVIVGCLPRINKDFFKNDLAGSIKITCLTSDDELDKMFMRKYSIAEIGYYKNFLDMYSPMIRKIKRYKLLMSYYFSLSSNILVRIFGWIIFYGELLGKKLFNFNKIPLKTFMIHSHSGCNHKCSYCVTRLGVGKVQSVPVHKIVDSFAEGLRQGYEYFELACDDLSQYGMDIGEKPINLLDKITDLPGNFKIYVRYIYPQWLINNFNDFLHILRRGKIFRVGIPVQSGSARIIKLMNRHYDPQNLKECLKVLRMDFPDLEIWTEFIVGFPGETEKDFHESLDFIPYATITRCRRR